MRGDQARDGGESREVEDAEGDGEDEEQRQASGRVEQEDEEQRAGRVHRGQKARPVESVGQPAEEDQPDHVAHAMGAVRSRRIDEREAAAHRVGNEMDVEHAGGGEAAEHERTGQQDEGPVAREKPEPRAQRGRIRVPRGMRSRLAPDALQHQPGQRTRASRPNPKLR